MSVQIRNSACPHDCPSTCALEVEVHDGDPHRHAARRAGQPVHGGRHLRQGRALRRAGASPRPPAAAADPRRSQGRGAVPGARWDEALDLVAERFSRGHGTARHARRSGRITSPARWGWCSGTASTGCATSCATRASTAPSAPPSAECRLVSPGSAATAGRTRARWPRRTSSSCGAATRSRPRSTS